jgi:hypothetical protein
MWNVDRTKKIIQEYNCSWRSHRDVECPTDCLKTIFESWSVIYNTQTMNQKRAKYNRPDN